MECDDCGEFKDDTVETICPYADEINDDTVECHLCEDCYYERCMGIQEIIMNEYLYRVTLLGEKWGGCLFGTSTKNV